MKLATARQLGRRSSVVVLLVTAMAVVMLGVLVVHTAQQGNDAPLVLAVTRQRYLSEQLVAEAMSVRDATPADRETHRHRMSAAALEWRDATARLRGTSPGGPILAPRSQAARDFAQLVSTQNEVIVAAERAAAKNAPRDAGARLAAVQRRYTMEMERIVADLESDSARRIDGLLLTETACVVLLLCALGFGVRLALQPTQERLLETLAALAESESRARAVLDGMQEGMLLTDASGRMLAWNSSAMRILEIDNTDTPTLDSVAGRVVDERGRPRSLDELPSRIAIRTGDPVTGATFGIRGASGDIRWMSANAHPIKYEGESAPGAAVSIFRDITLERRDAEERLAQAEALELQNRELVVQAEARLRGQMLYRSVVETAGSAIVGLDGRGEVFEWNREAELLYGVSRDQAVGRIYAETFVTPEYRALMQAGIASVLGGQPVRNFLGLVKSSSGEKRTVLWNITPLLGENGEVDGLIAAGLDITEREASDERFRILFERSADAHLLFDEEGVVDCNEATLRMLRHSSKDEVIGRRPVDLSPRRQPDGRLSVVVGAQMRQRARVQGFHRFEWTHLRSDGTQFPVEVTITPVRLKGREALLCVWHDITEQKAVEEALRAAKDAAESANRTKSEFMTRMNHELRTPLTAIIGFSRVLLQGKEGMLGEGASRYVDRIRANGMHLLSVINQILDVAKVEAGRMELEWEQVTLDELVRETLAMLESTAEAKGLTLRRELPSRVAPIRTDVGKLRQILINLVGNAIKFTAAGEVCVRLETDPVTDRPLALIVRDTGIGIARERVKKVFEPFEQGDASTRRQYGGTGLGLSIVKTFAGLIGARVSLESEVGRGTTVTLRLPVADQGLVLERKAG